MSHGSPDVLTEKAFLPICFLEPAEYVERFGLWGAGWEEEKDSIKDSILLNSASVSRFAVGPKMFLSIP